MLPNQLTSLESDSVMKSSLYSSLAYGYENMMLNTYLAEHHYQAALSELTERLFQESYNGEWVSLLDKLADAFTFEDEQLERMGITQDDMNRVENIMIDVLKKGPVDKVLSAVLGTEAHAKSIEQASEYVVRSGICR